VSDHQHLVRARDAYLDDLEALGIPPTDFQRAVSDAFLRVMRAKRPDVLWSAQTGQVGGVVTDPEDLDPIADGQPRAAA
jgi:hypothetical protein